MIESSKELKPFLKMLITGRTEDSYTRELANTSPSNPCHIKLEIKAK
ncbi:hypothetical protein [Treponema berlinense]|nr:hypothetical protein [Treponema berlinense]